MSGPNHAKNIIVNLASLPDFLRKPILRRRMAEFFSSSPQERDEIIRNALEAGPAIPFPNFSRLFRTWLEILAELPEGQRRMLFSRYVEEIGRNPQKLIRFHLDGILETYDSLGGKERAILSGTVGGILAGTDDKLRRRILMIIPGRAREVLGL